MRIISKFHDYYDGAMAHGQDQSVVFTRAEKTLKAEEFKCPVPFPEPRFTAFMRDMVNDEHDLCFVPFAILFCGILHRGIQVLDRKHRAYYAPARGEYDGESFFNQDDLRKYLEDCGFDTTDRLRRSYKGGRRKVPFFGKELAEFFADNRTDAYMRFCVDNGISILAITRRHHNGHYMTWSPENLFHINAMLKEFSFYKVHDAYSAYQELDMWISGVLPRSGNAMVEIEDKHKIIEHGFDRWSFRKMPSNA